MDMGEMIEDSDDDMEEMINQDQNHPIDEEKQVKDAFRSFRAILIRKTGSWNVSEWPPN